ncbi:hypothetical protein PENTCL1PPCAC_15136, partial [Pristionchus entomophagus]
TISRVLQLRKMCRIVMLALAVSVALAAARSPVPPTCASTSCPVGAACVETNGIARCIAPPASNCSIPHEEWRSCASCEPTCDNKQPMCVMMCQPARCQCRQGFFRNGEGRCVTENECDIAAGRGRRSTPQNLCENIKCAGACKNTPTGPVCSGPRPLIPPIWAGPSSTEAPRPEVLPIWAGPSNPVTLNACAVTECATGRVCVEEAGVAKCVERRTRRDITCANVRCAGLCKDTPTGPECGPRAQILPI